MHFACRMADGEVQRCEIIIIRLDIGTFRNREAHVAENGADLVDDLRDRMDTAKLGGRCAHRQRDIDAFGGKTRGDRGVLEGRLALGDPLGDLVLENVDCGTARLALFRAHRAQRLQELGNRPLLAQRVDTHGFDRRFVGRCLDFREQRGFQTFKIGHASHRLLIGAS